MKNSKISSKQIVQLSFTGLLFFCFVIVFSCDSKPPYNSRVAQAQRGAEIFKKNCVQCHSENGKGMMIDSLKTQTADLTQIMESRNAKEFPIVAIANIIDGRKMAKSHGSRVMPVWGEVFSKEEYLTEKEVKGKMAELIAYLMTIQE